MTATTTRLHLTSSAYIETTIAPDMTIAEYRAARAAASPVDRRGAAGAIARVLGRRRGA